MSGSPPDHASPPASTALSLLVPEWSDQLCQRGAGAGACVAEDGGGGDRAEVAAGLEVAVVGEAVEEPGGVQVAGAGGVDHLDRVGVDLDHVVTACHDGSGGDRKSTRLNSSH